jgi:hypothetical protein
MGYAVYHMEKGKGGSGGIGKHIDRTESRNGYTTFEHRNEKETQNNKNYILNIHCEKSLPTAIKDRIKEGYKGDKAIRKDAVRFQTHILTGSHEQMKAIFADENKKEKWIKANKEWMQERYGKENIVRFTLHVDEKTPHIHAVTVPITEDGRLSAKDYANGRKALRDMQTDYAKKMEGLGLKRGLERTGIKHETATEYYARHKEAENALKLDKISLVKPKKTLGITVNAKEIFEQNKLLAKRVAGLIRENRDQSSKLESARDMQGYDEKRADRAQWKEMKIFKENQNLIEIINDPERLAERFLELKEIEKEERLNQDHEQEQRQSKGRGMSM